jgi:predicted RNA binding protein YcfA (HicA-like mRNA interferase family)
MLALPHLSADELVTTLKRLGFRSEARASGLVKMCRYPSWVMVPETATLSPALLGAILRAAEIEPFDFVRALERRSEPAVEIAAESAPPKAGAGAAWRRSDTAP